MNKETKIKHPYEASIIYSVQVHASSLTPIASVCSWCAARCEMYNDVKKRHKLQFDLYMIIIAPIQRHAYGVHYTYWNSTTPAHQG